MKNNLKTKVMLAVLAGGMLCANGAWAKGDTPLSWYGKKGGTVVTTPDSGVYTGVNLTITDTFTDGSGNTVDAVTGGIYGCYLAESVSNIFNNSITFDTTKTINAKIYGGCSVNGVAGWDSSSSPNKVIVKKGTFNNSVYGGYSENNATKYNSVTISGGTFASTSSIYGGYSESGSAIGNIVTIKGGTFSGPIYGGWSDSDDATGNIVTIEGGTFGNTFKFFGGRQGTSKDSSGNILNLKTKITKASGENSMAMEVSYFQIMNFTLPANITEGDKKIMLKTSLLAVHSDSPAEINVTAANGVSLKAGDIITLIDVTNTGMVSGSFDPVDILGGAADFYYENGTDKNNDGDGKDLVIVLNKNFTSGGGGDQQKAPVEGVAAAAAMVNVSADLASGEGMDSMLATTAGGATDTFGAMSAGSSKFKTGSHVDVDGWGVVVGAGKTKEWTNGSATTMGIFLEYGKGDFDTYNGVFHGDGDTKNHGVGVMARHKTANNNYYEGNIRYGRQETSWGQSEIGGYETDSRYYGVMVGMGHIIQLGKNELDVYGRYSYGHVGACNAKVGNNDYRFDSVKSHRVRVGGKYNFVQANSKAKPFVGVAWEHEFNGESKATIAGVGQAPAPGLKGNTGIIQAGCDWDLGKKWTAGAGVNAYVGKRKGWDGMLRAVYNF